MAGDRYHHGSLRTALVTAALERARTGGPAALNLRELATGTGVSPAAVYRHFAGIDALIATTSQAAREALARTLIDARHRVASARPTQAGAARRLDAVGRAYIEFAVAEPRLFETAFTPCAVLPDEPDDPSAWQVLLDCVAELVDTGAIGEHAAADAPFIAWSAVHGLSNILVNAPAPTDIDVERATGAVVGGVLTALGIHSDRRRRG
jgi:AcrR family transcriptional regulator